MNVYALVAAALSAVTGAVHLFAGGKEVARPLLAANELSAIAKYTAYYTWHMATVVLFALCAGFFIAGIWPETTVLAAAATLLSAAFMVLSLALVVTSGAGLWTLPQWAFFAPITVVGALAVLAR